MTLKDIEEMTCNMLTVQQVADYLGCNPQLVRDEASKNPKYLGFPICKCGHSFKIPREGFINWVRGYIPVMQVISSNELFRSFERNGLVEGSDVN